MPDLLNTFVIAILAGVASAVTGLFGLAFTNRYTENRRLLDTTLVELEQLTDQCAKVASIVWDNIGRPSSAETSETICLLHDIACQIDFVTQRLPTSKLRINSHHLNFRRATTGDNFDVLNRNANPQRIGEIRSSAAALKMSFRAVIYDRNKFFSPI